ncbi:MAG: hypothetical protein WEB58_09560 [Planctomycetaceae bacterium]
MNCTQARQHWHLFHDSEGDAELHLQINDHLEHCPECARWFQQQIALEEAITHSLVSGREPTAAIWSRIERQLVPPQPARTKKWLLFGSAAFTLVASLLIAVSIENRSSPTPDLASLSVAVHDKLTSGREDPNFVSSSHMDIEDYLKQHVSFPVRCPPREDAGFEARGGGTCRLANDAAAYVVGQVDGESVSLFILSRDSLAHFPELQAMPQRQRTRHQQHGAHDILVMEFDQNLVLAVGKVRTERLQRLLNAYGSYPHDHGVKPVRQRAS